jgi:superfamily II DNA/RNA helicase
MIQVLKDRGFKRFFPVQYETFEAIKKGKDLIAKDRTGSGKTVAYSLPVIERFREEDAFKDGGRLKFLIVVPTREVVIMLASWRSRCVQRSTVCACGETSRWCRFMEGVTSMSR